mmetsp:Transcript_79789/g.246145  ORF Transcript_79789/g.246145 Transcript_79789/m.246145 type:complete len:216 (-) Transcript_79789:103-750(-)
MREGEALSSARKKDLRVGTVVTILQFSAGSERRARVRTETADGWISLETKHGRPFLGKVAGRVYPLPKLVGTATGPKTAPPRAMPLAGWDRLPPAPTADRMPVRPAPPGVERSAFPPVAAAESADAKSLDALLELGVDDLVDLGIFRLHEAQEFAGLPEDEKKRLVEMLKKELEEEERPPLREISLHEMMKGLRVAFYEVGVPQGELSFVPGLAG